MKDLFMWAADFMKNRPIYPMLRKLLSLLFVSSIVSWWYCHCYSSDLVQTLSTQKDWINFFIKGQFFIPIAMFLIVFIGTWLISFAIYKGLGTLLSVRIKRAIVKFQATHEDANEGSEVITKMVSRFTSERFGQQQQAEFYAELKSNVKPEDFEEIKTEMSKAEGAICDNFIMVCRMLMACCVYYSLVPQFSFWLFLTVTILLGFVLLNMFVAGLMCDLLPVLAAKLDEIADKYFKGELIITSVRVLNDGQ